MVRYILAHSNKAEIRPIVLGKEIKLSYIEQPLSMPDPEDMIEDIKPIVLQSSMKPERVPGLVLSPEREQELREKLAYWQDIRRRSEEDPTTLF